MKLVQMEVYERTRGRQLPYIEDALPDLVFADTKGEPLPERDRLLLAMAKIDNDTRTQVERIAAASDIPLAPLYGALLAGEAKAGPSEADAREKRLARASEDFVKVRNDLKTLESADPEVAALRKQAEQQLSLGAFDTARAALTLAIEVDRNSGERLETRLKERNLSEAASHAARAGVARTRLEYRVAATDLAEAAGLAERWDRQLAWRYTLDQAVTLYSQGNEFGDNDALTDAISIYGRALTLAPRTERQLDWATTQINIGNSLLRLGERESGTERLKEAVAAYRAALLENTRERVPLEWARTQNNLGAALGSLGERESDTALLEAAVATHRAALSERTRERVPLDWATTQNNLGTVLESLGARESGTARLEEAVSAYRAALLENTRERVPLDWAMTQSNIGNALSTLGRRESGTARLKDAVAAYRAALLENTRERVPLEWASTQNNLGVALHSIGDREANIERLEEAVAAYRAALLERTRERVPLEWERSRDNLDRALRRLDTARRANKAAR
jgi:tetratricopeptide (TPR) repeat protein